MSFGNTGGFGSGSSFGQASTGFGSTNTNQFGQAATGFGSMNTGGFGSTNTGGFGQNNQAGAVTGGFGQTATGFGSGGTSMFGRPATTATTGFGSGGTSGFGAMNTGGGFGSNTSAFGATGNTFGATTNTFGSTNTAGFGSGATGAMGPATNANANNGTASPVYAPVKDDQSNLPMTAISAMPAYANWSFEELRAADYLANRKNNSGKAPSTGFGARSTAGTGGFGSTNTASGFGTNTSGFGSGAATGFGSGTGFGSTNTGTGFGSTNTGFGSTNTASGFGAQPSTAGGFGSSTGFGSTNTAGGFGSANTGFGSSTTGFGAQPSATGGFGMGTGFGQTNAGGFGSTNTGTGFGSTNTAGGFGSTQTATPFGSANTAAGNTGFGFGTSNAAAPNTTGGFGFGSNTNTASTTAAASGSIAAPFGSANTGSSLFGGFGGASNTQPAPAFGAQASTTGFGSGGTGGFSFGSTAQPSAFGTGGQPAQQPKITTFFGGGSAGQPAAAAPVAGNTGFSFGAPATSTNSAFGAPAATSAAPSGSLFSFGVTAAPKPAFSGFSLGSQPQPVSLTVGSVAPAQPFALSAGQPSTYGSTFSSGNRWPGAAATGTKVASVDDSPYGKMPTLASLKTEAKAEVAFAPYTDSEKKAGSKLPSVAALSTAKPSFVSSPLSVNQPLRGFAFSAPKPSDFSGAESVKLLETFKNRKSSRKLEIWDDSAASATRLKPSTVVNRDNFAAGAPSLTPLPNSIASMPKTPVPQSHGSSILSNSPDEKSLQLNESSNPFTLQPTAPSPVAKTIDDGLLSAGASEYWSEPAMSTLMEYSKEQLQHVNDFQVGFEGYGSVRFLEPVDLWTVGSGLNPSNPRDGIRNVPGKIIQFGKCVVIVYSDESKKPPVGQGLNVPAEITLENCFATKIVSGVKSKDTDPSSHVVSNHVKKLKLKANTAFRSFDAATGVWVFDVKHFSKYGLYDDDSPDDSHTPNSVEPVALETPAVARVAVEVPKNLPSAIKSAMSTKVKNKTTFAVRFSPEPLSPKVTGPIRKSAVLKAANGADNHFSTPFNGKRVKREPADDETKVVNFQQLLKPNVFLVKKEAGAKPLIVHNVFSGPFKDVLSRRELASDAGLMMGTSFRVSWAQTASGWTLVRPSVQLGSSTALEIQQIRSDGPAKAFDGTSSVFLSWLESKSSAGAGMALRLDSNVSLKDLYGGLRDTKEWCEAVPPSNMEFLELASVIFDKSTSETEKKYHVGEWLKKSIASLVDEQLADTEAGSMERIYLLLSARRVFQACKEASDARYVHLAAVLAQITGPNVASFSHMLCGGGDIGSGSFDTDFVTQQLDIWHRSHAGKSVSQFIDPRQLEIWQLLSGNVDKWRQIGLDRKFRNWKCVFALVLWYAEGGKCSLSACLEHLRKFPFAYKQRDPALHLLISTVDSQVALDQSLKLVEPQTGLAVALFAYGAHVNVDIHVARFAQRCEFSGLWFEAVSACRLFASPELAERMVRELLVRHFPIRELVHGSFLDYLCRERHLESSEFGATDYFGALQRLCVPAPWIHVARAIGARYSEELLIEVGAFVDSRQWQEAHDLVVKFLVPSALFVGDAGLLDSVLSRFPATCMSGWSELAQWTLQCSRLLLEMNVLSFGDRMALSVSEPCVGARERQKSICVSRGSAQFGPGLILLGDSQLQALDSCEPGSELWRKYKSSLEKLLCVLEKLIPAKSVVDFDSKLPLLGSDLFSLLGVSSDVAGAGFQWRPGYFHSRDFSVLSLNYVKSLLLVLDNYITVKK